MCDGRDRDDDPCRPAQKLLGDQNATRIVKLARNTFEWDLVAAGNWPWALAALARLETLVAGLGLDRLELTENWRSSSRICSSAVEFCDRTAADHAGARTPIS